LHGIEFDQQIVIRCFSWPFMGDLSTDVETCSVSRANKRIIDLYSSS